MKALHRMTIWSLGCVLSSFATWIVFGPDGYDEYHRLRSRAIRAMPTAQTDEGVSLHKCGFHDGFALLQSVKDWHQFLCLSLRLSDTITGKVLDLIEAKLLVNDPKERISSRELVRVLEEIIVQAKHDYDTAIKNREMLPDEFFKELQDLDIEKYGSTHVSKSPDADSSDDEEAAHEAWQSQSSRSASLDRSSVSGAKSPTDDEKTEEAPSPRTQHRKLSISSAEQHQPASSADSDAATHRPPSSSRNRDSSPDEHSVSNLERDSSMDRRSTPSRDGSPSVDGERDLWSFGFGIPNARAKARAKGQKQERTASKKNDGFDWEAWVQAAARTDMMPPAMPV